MNDIHLATCWHHLSKLASHGRGRGAEQRWLARHKSELAPLRDHTFAMLPIFEPRGLSNTCYALAVAGLKDAQLMTALAEAAMPRLGEFKPQAMANTAWAYATAKHASPSLFDALAEAAIPRLGEFKPQDMAMMKWAYAAANHKSASLFESNERRRPIKRKKKHGTSRI